MEVKVGKDCSLLYITAVQQPVHALLESHLQSSFGPQVHIWPQLQGIQYTILDCLPSDNVSLIEQKIHSDHKISTNKLTFCMPHHTGRRAMK